MEENLLSEEQRLELLESTLVSESSREPKRTHTSLEKYVDPVVLEQIRDPELVTLQNKILTILFLLTIFAVAGIQVLSIFGISIYSFMVAGGILLFIISIEFLTHGEWRYSGSSASGDSGIIPLAFPLLAGPGAITTVMISLQACGWVVSIISIVFVVLVTYLVLHVENLLLKILGSRGSIVTTRIFAIFLAAIAIQYIVEGVKQLLQLAN